MSDLINSLSGTPLPTILVVAGVVFLFLSIGGRLGAQIATDTIKRTFAGVLGSVLLIGGISLYMGGQLYDQAPEGESKPSKVTNKKTYTLRADSVPPGRIIEVLTQFSWPEANMTIVSGADQTKNVKISVVSNEITKSEILSSLGGRPTALKETILSDTTKTTTYIDGDEKTVTEEGSLSGHSILIEKQGGRWVKSLLGAEPTAEQQAELREPYGDEYETYPAGSVEVGTTWALDGPQLAHICGFGNLLSIAGSANLTFDGIVQCGEEKCAAISLKRIELSGDMLVDGEIVKFELGGYGTGLRSISNFIDIESSIEGTMRVEQKTIIDEKEVVINIVGPIKSISSEKIVGQ